MTLSRKSRGIVLLSLLVALIVTFSTIVLLNLNLQADKYSEQRSLQKNMRQARDALLAYAVTYADNYSPTGAGPGHFPCPDLDMPDTGAEGPNPPCSSAHSNIGRLPRLVAGSSTAGKVMEFYSAPFTMDRRLWYGVSKNFVNNPLGAATIVNPDSEAQLVLDGERDIVAILLAPGPELTDLSQVRPSIAVTDYLEHENSDHDNEYSYNKGYVHNDLLVVIRRQELMPLLKKRVAGFVRDWLLEYRVEHCLRDQDLECFPRAAPESDSVCDPSSSSGWLASLSGGCDDTLLDMPNFQFAPPRKHWFLRNQWYKYIRYHVEVACYRFTQSNCQADVGLEVIGGVKYASINIYR